MSRWVYLLGVGMALVALAFLVTEQLTTPPPGVTVANCERIRVGMTFEQVKALFGEPPYWDCDLASDPWLTRWGKPDIRRGQWRWDRTWRNGRLMVFVMFNTEDRVSVAHWFPEDGRSIGSTNHPKPSPFQRLRSWLDW
jgi:hypothetical protein